MKLLNCPTNGNIWSVIKNIGFGDVSLKLSNSRYLMQNKPITRVIFKLLLHAVFLFHVQFGQLLFSALSTVAIIFV